MMPKPSSGPSSRPDEATAAETTDEPFSDPSSLPTSTAGADPALNGRGPLWEPTSAQDAEEAIADAFAFCSRRCPIFDACVGEACHVYRVEQRALRFRDGPEKYGVLPEPTIGVA